MLYTTPKSLYISDITTSTKVGEDLSAEFSFDVEYHLENQEKEDVQCNIQLLDGAEDRVVAESFSCRDTRRLAAPKLWWPHLMSEQPGHMYQLRVSVISVKHGMDEYSLGVGLRQTCQRCSMMFNMESTGLLYSPVRTSSNIVYMSGLRQVSWSNSSLLINNKPFYFRGFGRHEDSNIRGKGADLPLFARDYNLIKWMGANSYRTSHYPYDDQLMDFADRNGIVIIDECPGVALDHFEAPLLAHHLAVMTELVARDKNHPSVIMWSVGNEPRSYRNQSGGQPRA